MFSSLADASFLPWNEELNPAALYIWLLLQEEVAMGLNDKIVLSR